MSANVWSLLFLATGLVVYLANYLDYMVPPVIQFYLNDLLIVPITAGVARFSMRWLFRVKNYILNLWQTCYIVVFYSLVFEGLLPFMLPRYTGDFIDVLLYIAGGAFYWTAMNKH
jgi:hypothetical protein